MWQLTKDFLAERAALELGVHFVVHWGRQLFDKSVK